MAKPSLGKKVVYLAPTLALVSQIASDLRKTFPDARGASGDEMSEEDLSTVSVMTPERCLTLLGFQSRKLSQKWDYSSLMNVTSIHPQGWIEQAGPGCHASAYSAFFGFSIRRHFARFCNGQELSQELADWIKSLVGRKVLALASNWKPTRQARGCVVYEGARIDELKRLISQDASTRTTATISAPVRRKLTVRPLGMFSLHQTWTSRNEADYAILPLLETDVCLDARKVSRVAKCTLGRRIATCGVAGDRGAIR